MEELEPLNMRDSQEHNYTDTAMPKVFSKVFVKTLKLCRYAVIKENTFLLEINRGNTLF